MNDKPKLLYRANVRRAPYFRRFMWNVLAMVTAFAAWGALIVAEERDSLDFDLLSVGQVVALVVSALMLLRSVRHLIRWLRTKNESIALFDRGFVWKRGKKQHKYSWPQVKAFRENAKSTRILGRAIFKRGANTLITQDGKTFDFTHKHGDPAQFARVIRPHLAEVMGSSLAQALRAGRTIKLHPQLAMNSKGMIAGEHKIRWSQVDISMQQDRLIILRLNNNGQFKPVMNYRIGEIDNLVGFLDMAESLMQNHQPERFNIKVQVPPQY